MYPYKLFAKPLERTEQESLIEAFRRHLANFADIKTLYLIGSASRLQMTDASDLDFVAIFESESAKENAKNRFYTSPRPANWPCDVLWYTSSEFEARSKIGGICMIAAQDGVKMDLSTAAD